MERHVIHVILYVSSGLYDALFVLPFNDGMLTIVGSDLLFLRLIASVRLCGISKSCLHLIFLWRHVELVAPTIR